MGGKSRVRLAENFAKTTSIFSRKEAQKSQNHGFIRPDCVLAQALNFLTITAPRPKSKSVAGSWLSWYNPFTARNKWINCIELMDANWVKLVAVFLISVLDVVIAAGCRQERVGSTACIQPQYRSNGLVVQADVDSQQTTTTASTKPVAQKESIGAASTPPAKATAASTNTKLDSLIDLSSITEYTPFGRAIEVLRNSTRPLSISWFFGTTCATMPASTSIPPWA